MSISVLCLFVDMKRLQNEISLISTNLIRNLKIKIISISVLNRYFFENRQLCIESISNRILSVSCIDFSISPILVQGVLSVWQVGSEVGSGLLYWCNSRDVLQIWAVVFCTGSSVPNPVPILGLFSSSPSSNQTSYLRGVQQKPSNQKRNRKIFSLDETSFVFLTVKGSPTIWLIWNVSKLRP